MLLVGILLNVAVATTYVFNGQNLPLEASSTPKTVNSISPRIKAILADLRKCESSNNDTKINPVDTDGTSSYGRYQFKPSTLYYFATRYKILTNVEPKEIQNVIMDGELQERVLIEMLKEDSSEAFLLQQFPACSRKYKFWN